VDNLTHSLVGATLAELALPAGAPRTTRRTFFIAGIVAANLPDADLVYTGITPPPLGALLHHRGHTHTMAGLAVLGLAMAAIWMLPALRDAVGPLRRRFWILLAVALTSHLVLDSWNSYGVHPFWPVSSRWYYGDAVFIMEPWLWLLLGTAATLNTVSRWGHALLGGSLALVASGAAFVRMVPFGGLAMPALCAIALGVAMRRWAPRRRSAVALGLSLTFVAASFVVREVVRGKVLASNTDAVRPELVDLVLSPRGGNPLCWTVVSVVRDERAGSYSMTRGDVAVLARSACGSPRGSDVQWGDPTVQSLAQLRTLYRDDCWVRGWMQFGRAPAVADGTISDLRYGNSFRGNFTTMTLQPPADAARCPANLTAWRPPRADLLGGDVERPSPGLR
jgi:inner membrane protein